MAKPQKTAQLQSVQIQPPIIFNKIIEEQDNRPRHARVFGRNFNIVYSKLIGGDTSNLGLTHWNECIVDILEGQHPLEEKDTVLHEFIHVVDKVMECGLSERQVTILAHGLAGIFQDNPKFAQYIIEKVDI